MHKNVIVCLYQEDHIISRFERQNQCHWCQADMISWQEVKRPGFVRIAGKHCFNHTLTNITKWAQLVNNQIRLAIALCFCWCDYAQNSNREMNVCGKWMRHCSECLFCAWCSKDNKNMEFELEINMYKRVIIVFVFVRSPRFELLGEKNFVRSWGRWNYLVSGQWNVSPVGRVKSKGVHHKHWREWLIEWVFRVLT